MQKTMHCSKTSPALPQQNISRTPALKHLLHSRNKTPPTPATKHLSLQTARSGYGVEQTRWRGGDPRYDGVYDDVGAAVMAMNE